MPPGSSLGFCRKNNTHLEGGNMHGALAELGGEPSSIRQKHLSRFLHPSSFTFNCNNTTHHTQQPDELFVQDVRNIYSRNFSKGIIIQIKWRDQCLLWIYMVCRNVKSVFRRTQTHKPNHKKRINLTEFPSDLFVFFVDNRFLGVGYITNKQTSKLKSMEIKEWIDVRLITFKKDLKRLLVILTICQI